MGNVIPKNRKAYGYDYADLGSVVNYVTEVLGFRVEQDIHYNNLPQLSERVRVRRLPTIGRISASLGANTRHPFRSLLAIPLANVNSRSCNGTGVRKRMLDATVCSPCSVWRPVMMTDSWRAISVEIR